MAQNKTLGIFFDESGKFLYPDSVSRFYILGMVFCDCCEEILPFARELDKANADLGLNPSSSIFHAGPLIRREKVFAEMERGLRARIFNRMMSFARRAPFRWHCIFVDKKHISSTLQIITKLRAELERFLSENQEWFNLFGKVELYYDCGQTPLTNLLHRSFETALGEKASFIPDVKPEEHKLLQVADMVCTLKLIDLRIENNIGLTPSEERFFGGHRAFRKNIWKTIVRKSF